MAAKDIFHNTVRSALRKMDGTSLTIPCFCNQVSGLKLKCWIIVTTQNKRLVFTSGEVISTQTVLPGFSVAVDELLA